MQIKKFKLFEQEITLTDNQPSQEEVKSDEKPTEAQTQETETKDSTTPSNIDISKYFSKLFEARQMAHIYHLQVKGDTGSYAAHVALGSYYDDLLEFLDNIIEVYQGQYGIIESYEPIDTKDSSSKDKVAYFEELVNFIKTEKKCIKSEDSHLLNIVDEIVALNYKLLYKLKFNK